MALSSTDESHGCNNLNSGRANGMTNIHVSDNVVAGTCLGVGESSGHGHKKRGRPKKGFSSRSYEKSPRTSRSSAKGSVPMVEHTIPPGFHELTPPSPEKYAARAPKIPNKGKVRHLSSNIRKVLTDIW
jgi:hypothetical protein